MAKANLTVKVDADVRRAADGIQSIDKKIDDIGKSAEKSSDKLKTLLSVGGMIAGAVAGFKALAGAAQELVSIYSIQEQAEARLSNTIRATGNAAGVTMQGMKDLASSLQAVTTFGDESIVGIESLYVATGKIGNEVMPRATEAALDMAAAMGTDVTEAARKLSRVLADPTQGLDALKESNIMLTKAQMEEIKQMALQGDALGAQSKILEAVEAAYSGTARAIADTDTGKLTQIGNVYGDIKEGLGSALLDTISPALEVLYGWLLLISEWVGGYATKVEISKAAREGISLEGYSLDELTAAETVAENAMLNYQEGSHPYNQNKIAYNNIHAEMNRRAEKRREEAARVIAGMLPEEPENPENPEEPPVPAVPAAKSFFDTYGKNTAAYLDEFYDQEIEKGKQEQASLEKSSMEYKAIGQAIDDLIAKKKALHAVKPPEDIVGTFIDRFGGMSEAAQLAEVEKNLADADTALAEALAGGDTASQDIINEIIIGLQKQKNIILGIKTEEELIAEEKEKQAEADRKAAEARAKEKQEAEELRRTIHSITSQSADVLGKSFGLADQLMANQISELGNQLSEAESMYQKYFDHIDGMYAEQQNGIDRYFAAGLMSAEDYVAASEALTEEETAAREKAQDEQEKIQEKADALKEAQFKARKANDVAQATINGAMAITDIWAQHAANPAVAWTLTGLTTAAVGLQIGTILAQKYTPMAAGGVVNSPTHALIGEAGPEAIIPLNQYDLQRSGAPDQNKGITIVVNVENNYSESDLVENVYNGIEKAQRAGLLPSWSFA